MQMITIYDEIITMRINSSWNIELHDNWEIILLAPEIEINIISYILSSYHGDCAN